MTKQQAIIGTYYKTEELAIKEMERKNKIYKRNTFEVRGFKKGFIVVRREQLK